MFLILLPLSARSDYIPVELYVSNGDTIIVPDSAYAVVYRGQDSVGVTTLDADDSTFGCILIDSVNNASGHKGEFSIYYRVYYDNMMATSVDKYRNDMAYNYDIDSLSMFLGMYHTARSIRAYSDDADTLFFTVGNDTIAFEVFFHPGDTTSGGAPDSTRFTVGQP